MDMDDAYANAAHIPQANRYPPRWSAAAAAFRDSTECALDLPYGDSPRQVFDLFHPAGVPKGCVVFVHGGYWLRFDKSFWSHLAAGPLAHGWAVAMPSYDLCPDVTIAQITRQVAAAMDVIAGRVPGPLRLCGHSAGGHLVARMLDPALSAPWQARLAAVVPISPLADLAPLRQTAMNLQFSLNAQDAEAESPVFQPKPEVPVTVWVGGDERPAFLEQADLLGTAWECPVTIRPGRHHFDVIDALARPDSDLITTLLA